MPILAIAALLAAIVTAPKPLLDVTTTALPKTPTSNVQVIRVTLKPGDASTWHTHPTPPFVYVESGTGTWEFRGGPSITRMSGQAIMEPANTITRLVNRGATPLTIVIFQATAPGQKRITNVSLR